MKKTLIKLISLSLLITAVSACGNNNSSEINDSSSITTSHSSKSGPIVLTPAELYDLQIDTETIQAYSPYEGQKVMIEDLHLMAHHGNTGYFYQLAGQYVTDLWCIEADVGYIDYESDYGPNCITLTGTVKYEDSRIHLVDANYECLYSDPSFMGFAGLDEHTFNRAAWNTYYKYDLHGVLSFGRVQLASVPTFADPTKDETFYVVFPGDDYDMSNPDNLSPLPVTIPHDLSKPGRAELMANLNAKFKKVYAVSRFSDAKARKDGKDGRHSN